MALPSANATVPDDLVAALAGIGKGKPTAIAAGTAAAIAEQWCGAARGVNQVITFSIAEHVTAGVLVNGKPWRGAHGLGSSVGWLALNPVEREDYRRLGGLEAEVAAAGIVRRCLAHQVGDRRSADMAGGDLAAIHVHQIFDAARKGDGVSISVVRDTARYIGMAVANLVAIADPNVVVLGGLIADAADQLLQPSRAEALLRLPKTMAESLTVTAATLGDDGGPLGAARAATLAR